MLIKLVLKNCVTSIEDSAWTKKELELTFSLNQAYSIWKSVIEKTLTQL